MERLLKQQIAAAILTAAVLSPASAADPVRGKMLYENTNGAPLSCATDGACHGPDPSKGLNGIKNGTTGTKVLAAVNSVSAMSFLKTFLVSIVDADDIAAYIVNPASGTPSPAAALSTATLAFGNQIVQTPSATMSATLKNTGSANLLLSSVTLGGTNPGDFTRTGSCAAALSLAPAQTCSIDVSFKPSALGTRSATVTVGHNASPATSTLTLSGSGVTAPAPAVALSATSIAFGDQTVGTTSTARTVQISNTGTANLALGAIASTQTNATDFAPSNCSGASLAPGANCTISVTFTPAALGGRTATLSIPSNAANSPHGVALSGNGTAVPAPAVALNPTSLAFGNQTVGTTSGAKSFTLTNSGNAALAISLISTTGSGFASSHNCPMSLAAGANCTVSVTFTPTSATTYTAAVSVASSAAGSPHSVGVTGTGTAAVPLAPQVTLAPLAVDFGTLPLNTTSATRNVSLTNSGNAPLSLTALTLAGSDESNFSQTNDCPVGGTLAAGGACSVALKFTPTVAGARAASLTVTSNAPGAPAVDLKGMGVVQAAAVAQVAPAQFSFGSIRLGKTSDERTVRVRNTGTTPLVIASISVTGDFLQKNECKPTLPPGEACEVKVQFKPTALGTLAGELTVASNAAGSPHAVKLAGIGVTRTAKGKDGDDEEECEPGTSCSRASLPFWRRK